MESFLEFTLPSEEIGFVEYKRSFVVQGKINIDIPNNALLTINLLNENKKIVRYIKCDKKNKSIYVNHPDLTTYKEELDPKRIKMQEFGFPELVVDDIDNPEKSLHLATNKLWYSDYVFKGIFISASDISHGAIFDDGMDYLDDNGNSYTTLECGNYVIEAILSFNNFETKISKKIVIGTRDKQLICRFNPISHKLAMQSWCKDNNISIINDLMPGYLDAYLGKWYYHMGLLKMYRANDICLYIIANIIMFIYLIDETSTSYATELGYLQANNALKQNRLTYYHYDIGEAIIGKNRLYEKKANIIKFNNDEYIYLCRIDIVNKDAKENIYYLDERDVIDTIIDFNNIRINSGKDIAIMGIIKPWQLDINDVILKDDNTYLYKNYPNIIRYILLVDDKEYILNRKPNMERIDSESIGKSIYEFYNIIHIDDSWSNKNINIKVECIDAKGNSIASKDFKIYVE